MICILKGSLAHFPNTHRFQLDFSSIDLDNSHITSIKGVKEERSGQKETQNQQCAISERPSGAELAISNPVAGNHNDLYGLEVYFEVKMGSLEQVNIQVNGFLGLTLKRF